MNGIVRLLDNKNYNVKTAKAIEQPRYVSFFHPLPFPPLLLNLGTKNDSPQPPSAKDPSTMTSSKTPTSNYPSSKAKTSPGSSPLM